MLLLLSDLHLGRGTAEQTRAAERDAVDLLRAHEAEVVPGPGPGGTVVLLGDVYDQFIEYRHLIPKGAVRLVGLLADWADRGTEVVYVVGNRDPWHVDFFEAEVGAVLVPRAWQVRRGGRSLYIAHGDGHAPARSLPDRIARRLQPLLRAPLMARLYRMGLPGDAGFAFARSVAHRFGGDGTPDPADAEALAAAARHRLAETAADVVAFGHSHRAALDVTDAGTYLNPGYWFGDRTFGRIDAAGPALLRWRDGRAEPLAGPLGGRARRPAPALS